MNEPTKGLAEIMSGMPTYVTVSGAHADAADRLVVVFDFSLAGFGFGEIAMVQTAEHLYVDSECMGPEKVLGFFRLLLERATFDTDQDPEAHKRYNEVMGRACGPRCGVCHREPSP